MRRGEEVNVERGIKRRQRGQKSGEELNVDGGVIAKGTAA